MENNLATPPLHAVRRLRRRHFYRIFAALHSLAILSLLFHHLNAIRSSGVASVLLFIADILLAFSSLTGQAFRLNPVVRKEFPENLPHVIPRKDYPPMDIFICTADPDKEPPMVALNTALSVMAYDYPPEKLSVYVSDDGGSALTMFAFMEAAKFAENWLPFCRENNILDRNPDAFSFNSGDPKTMEIKRLYQAMKTRVEAAARLGEVHEALVPTDAARRILSPFISHG